MRLDKGFLSIMSGYHGCLNAKAPRCGRLRRLDGRGVGGFMEALLAISVITVGLVMITASLNYSRTSLEAQSNDLEMISGRIIEQVMGDSRIFDGTTARYALFCEMDLDGIDGNGAAGFRMVLVEISEVHSPPICHQYGEPYEDLEDCQVDCRPVNSFHAPHDIRAALLYSWVW